MVAPPKKTYGRATVALHAHFRPTAAGADFPELLRLFDAAPIGPRHVSLMAQKPGTRAPPHSELQNHVLTLYVPLSGGDAGLQIGSADAKLEKHAPFVLDSTFKHATYNNGNDDAFFLVADFWHPDLSPTEVDALTAFLKLDEQFILRRSQSLDVVRALQNTERPLTFLE